MKSLPTPNESVPNNPVSDKLSFWTPFRTTIVGFIVFLSIIVIYTLYTGSKVKWLGLIAMLIMYAAVYYIGAKAGAKKGTDMGSMMVAGRSMPLWIATFTMTATWLGGGYLTGTAESVYKSGLVWTQAPWGYALSLIFAGIFFARKMRRYEFMTMLDPLEARYGKKMAAVLYIPAVLSELFWSAAVLVALGTTFGVILGLSFSVSIIFSAAIAIAYTVVGGLWAVAYTDVIQLLIMFVGLFLVLPFAFSNVGGYKIALTNYQEGMTGYLNLFPPLMGWTDPDWGNYFWNWWDFALLLIIGGIPWQSYFQRVLSARNENTAMWLSIVAGLLCLVAAIPPALIGIVGFSANWEALGIAAPENPSLILAYVFEYMTPAVIGAIALGSLAAAVMASVDSSFLSASSMAAWNVYRPLVRPHANADQLKKVIRRSIIVVGVTATLIALNVQSVYALWYLCADLVYVILFPQLTTALFYKGANKNGAIAGLIVAVVLRAGGGESLLGIPPILPYPMVEDGVVLFPFRTFAMLASLVTIFIVSYFTRHTCPPMPLRNPNRDNESKTQQILS
jgi:high affinity choline transporter 7